MKNIPEELLYVLMFAVIVLLQHLMKRFGPQQQPQQLPQDEPEPEFPKQERAAPEASWGSTASDFRFDRTEAPSASAPPPRRRFTRRSLLGNKREVQNAIVIATIVGPCRAFEPHEGR